MTLQDTLFIAGIVVLGIGLVLLGIAAYIFFGRNILDILADLNGTKRAEALAAMAKESSNRSRRRRTGEATGQIATPTDGMGTDGRDGASSKQAMAESADSTPAYRPVGESDSTTVMEDDTSQTTVMDDDTSQTTVMASEVTVTTMLNDMPITNVPMVTRPGEAAVTTVIDSVPKASTPVAYSQDESAPTLILEDPEATNATTILSQGEASDPDAYITEVLSEDDLMRFEETAQTRKQVVTPDLAPLSFHIVRKIVLTQSAEYIVPEQGDYYA